VAATLTRMDGDLWMLVRDNKKLARLLVIQEISHRQLATALGWRSHSYVGRLVRGEIRSVDPEAALRIAHLLGVAVDDLFIIKVSSESGHYGQKVPA
jgi:transcriptional regulator with XRE-family HTH domain